jgi:hypothetical protein
MTKSLSCRTFSLNYFLCIVTKSQFPSIKGSSRFAWLMVFFNLVLPPFPLRVTFTTAFVCSQLDSLIILFPLLALSFLLFPPPSFDYFLPILACVVSNALCSSFDLFVKLQTGPMISLFRGQLLTRAELGIR